MKLSNTQRAVLEKMTQGYALFVSRTYEGGAHLDYKTVRVTTVHKLVRNKLIATSDAGAFPVVRYAITNEGRKALEQ